MARTALRITAVLALLLALGVFGVIPWWLAGLATTRRFAYPDTENAGLTPASFALPFEEIRFPAADGVDLRGWWVPAPRARGSVVLVHGLNRSRIEMVRKVPFLHERGWNALLFDLRHHGESGGERSSFGWHERADVRAAADLARARHPGPVVTWGVSLGGATAVLEAADDPGIAGVVCDSSYRSLPDTVRHHVDLARSWRWWLAVVPRWPVAEEVLFWIGRGGGFDPAAVDVEGAASHLRGRPSLFICNSGDRRMPSEIASALAGRAGGSVLVVPGDSHGGAWREGTAAYRAAVDQVLDAVAPRATPEERP